MSITWIGIVEFLIGIPLLIWGDAAAMLIFVVATSLLGASAALALPALGGSTIPPAYFALGFMVLRVFVPGSGMLRFLPRAIQLNGGLILFCLYGAFGAFILPRIFTDIINVTPMRPLAQSDLYATSPLEFSSQNITTAVYLVGTMVAGIAASAVAARPKLWSLVIGAFGWVTWVEVGLGILQVILKQVGLDNLLDPFRNGNYAQLDALAGNFVRIKGLFPEASSYAAFTFVLMVLVTEAWVRGLRPRLTGSAAIASALVLVFSTSSSAFVSLGGYALIMGVRWMLFPMSLPSSKALRVVVFIFVAILACLIVAKLQPTLLSDLSDIIRQMTVDKQNSSSGMQRSFWAKQGITAFTASYGLGVGPGSFRSSSLLTSIMGSVGVIGLVSFAVYLWATFRPLRTSTYESARLPPAQLAGICCGWAAVLGLIPAAVAAPTPDPGVIFGLLAGLSLGWRSAPVTVERPVERPSRDQRRLSPPSRPVPGPIRRPVSRGRRLGPPNRGLPPSTD